MPRIARGSRFPSAVSRGARRESEWFSVPFSSTTMTALGGTLISSLNAAALALRPFTVVRTRLELFVVSDQEGASEVYNGALGMAVVSDQAAAIGVTAIPTPVTDLASDLWFVHQPFFGSIVVITAIGAINEGWPYTVDSKAMRKVNGDQDVVIVGEVSGISSGATLQMAGRMLVKLH